LNLSFPSDEQVVFRWLLNSLFSRYALDKLADESGCNHNLPTRYHCNDKYRTINGTCNNIHNPLFGSAPTAFTRLLPAIYYDTEGLNDPIGFPGQSFVPDIPATFKVIRQLIVEQDKPNPLSPKFSHALMQFGQFLDHDLDLSPEIENSDKCTMTRYKEFILCRLLFVKYYQLLSLLLCVLKKCTNIVVH
jgi:hypothetical protein